MHGCNLSKSSAADAQGICRHRLPAVVLSEAVGLVLPCHRLAVDLWTIEAGRTAIPVGNMPASAAPVICCDTATHDDGHRRRSHSLLCLCSSCSCYCANLSWSTARCFVGWEARMSYCRPFTKRPVESCFIRLWSCQFGLAATPSDILSRT